jgi:hypothetical protein
LASIVSNDSTKRLLSSGAVDPRTLTLAQMGCCALCSGGLLALRAAPYDAIRSVVQLRDMAVLAAVYLFGNTGLNVSLQ